LSTRLIKRTEFTVRETTARALSCAHCTRDSMTFNSEGAIGWLSPHGTHAHANGITITMLLRKIVPHLGVSVLRELRRIVDEQLEKVAA
jgi:hypothetical protein